MEKQNQETADNNLTVSENPQMVQTQSNFIKFENSNTEDVSPSQTQRNNLGSQQFTIVQSPGDSQLSVEHESQGFRIMRKSEIDQKLNAIQKHRSIHDVQRIQNLDSSEISNTNKKHKHSNRYDQQLVHGSYQISNSDSREPTSQLQHSQSHLRNAQRRGGGSQISHNTGVQGGTSVPFNHTSGSKGYGNKVTQPGATVGDPEDSSVFNSQTNNMIKEIDIDIEVGGMVSNMSYSSTVNFMSKQKKDKSSKNKQAKLKLPFIDSPKKLQMMQTNSPINTEMNSATSHQGSSDLKPVGPNFLPQIKQKDGLVTGTAAVAKQANRTRNNHPHKMQIQNPGLQNMSKQILKSKFDISKNERDLNTLVASSSSKRNTRYQIDARSPSGQDFLTIQRNRKYMSTESSPLLIHEQSFANRKNNSNLNVVARSGLGSYLRKDESIQNLGFQNQFSTYEDAQSNQKMLVIEPGLKQIQSQRHEDMVSNSYKNYIGLNPQHSIYELQTLDGPKWQKHQSQVTTNIRNLNRSVDVTKLGDPSKINLRKILNSPTSIKNQQSKKSLAASSVYNIYSQKSLGGGSQETNVAPSQGGTYAGNQQHPSVFLSEDGIATHIRQIATRMLKEQKELEQEGTQNEQQSPLKGQYTDEPIEKLNKKQLNVDLPQEHVYKPLVSFEDFIAQKNKDRIKDPNEVAKRIIQNEYEAVRTRRDKAMSEVSVENNPNDFDSAQDDNYSYENTSYLNSTMQKPKKVFKLNIKQQPSEKSQRKSKYLKKKDNENSRSNSSLSIDSSKNNTPTGIKRFNSKEKVNESRQQIFKLEDESTQPNLSQTSPPKKKILPSQSSMNLIGGLKKKNILAPQHDSKKKQSPVKKTNFALDAGNHGSDTDLPIMKKQQSSPSKLRQRPTRHLTEKLGQDPTADDLQFKQQQIEVQGQNNVKQLSKPIEPAILNKMAEELQTQLNQGKQKYIRKRFANVGFEIDPKKHQPSLMVFNSYQKKVMQNRRSPSPRKQLGNFIAELALERIVNQSDGVSEHQQKKIFELANIEIADVDLFEYTDQNTRAIMAQNMSLEESQRDSVNKYMNYLTRGTVSNRIVFEFSRSLRKTLKTDLISKFNMKSLDLVDSLVQEVIQKMEFKDLSAKTKPTKSQNQLTQNESSHKNYDDYKNLGANKNAVQRFVSESLKTIDNASVLPILQKIYAGTLILANYQLNKVACRALREGLMSDPKILDTLHIDNCNIKDQELSDILDGASHLKQLKSLTLKRTTIGQDSVNKLEKIFSKPFPCQLQIFQIFDCRLSYQLVDGLLKALEKGDNLIHTLGLVKIGLKKDLVTILCKFFSKENPALRNIDLSRNYMRAEDTMIILKCLGQKDLNSNEYDTRSDSDDLISNLNLDTLNLSENQLFDQFKFRGKNQSLIGEHEEKISQFLMGIVDSNPTMIHLDFSHCGLSEPILKDLISSIRQSPSLVGVHLSYNPGINASSIEVFKEQLGAETFIDRSKDFTLRFQEKEQAFQKSQFDEILSSENRQRLQAKRIQREKSKLQYFRQDATLPHIPCFDVLEESKMVDQLEVLGEFREDNQRLGNDKEINETSGDQDGNKTFLLTKVIGHDDEFREPLSRWKLNTVSDHHCWICDRQIYSVMFWNMDIGKLQNIELKNKSELIKKIRRINKNHRKLRQQNKEKMKKEQEAKDQDKAKQNLIEDLSAKQKKKQEFQNTVKPERPRIYSHVTGWLPKTMLTLSEYCFLIDKKKTPFRLNKLKYPKIKNFEFQTDPQTGSIDQFGTSMHSLLKKQKHVEFDTELYQRLLSYKDPSHPNYQSYRDVIQQHLEHRDPQFINVSTLCLKFISDQKQNPTTFVIPQFLQSGRFSYVIEYPRGKFFFHKSVIHFREEPIPIQIFQDSNPKQFDVKTSQFGDWAKDDEQLIQQCFESDIANLHLPEIFAIKHDEGISEIEANKLQKIVLSNIEGVTIFLRRHFNFSAIKLCYIMTLSKSKQVNGVDLQAFQDLILKNFGWNQKLNKLEVQVIFKTAILEKNEIGIKRDPDRPKNLLCRKEFIEALFQCARFEFSDLGDSKLPEVLDQLLEQVVKYNEKQDNWHSFREKELWNQECSELFKTNKTSIQLVWNKFNKVIKNTNGGNEQKISWDRILDLVMSESKPPICSDEQSVIEAFVLSKQTVEHDFQAGGQIKMKSINKAEFLEFIARIADIQSRDSTQHHLFLHEKIERILGPILRSSDDFAKVRRVIQPIEEIQKLQELTLSQIGKQQQIDSESDDESLSDSEYSDDDEQAQILILKAIQEQKNQPSKRIKVHKELKSIQEMKQAIQQQVVSTNTVPSAGTISEAEEEAENEDANATPGEAKRALRSTSNRQSSVMRQYKQSPPPGSNMDKITISAGAVSVTDSSHLQSPQVNAEGVRHLINFKIEEPND